MARRNITSTKLLPDAGMSGVATLLPNPYACYRIVDLAKRLLKTKATAKRPELFHSLLRALRRAPTPPILAQPEWSLVIDALASMHLGDGTQGGQPVDDVDRNWVIYRVYKEEHSSQLAGSVKRTRQRLQGGYGLNLSERTISRTIKRLNLLKANRPLDFPDGQ